MSKETIGGPAAPWLVKKRERISRRAGKDANRVRRALSHHGVELTKRNDRIATDLGDLLEAFRHITLSVQELSKGNRRGPRTVHALLTAIWRDLYIHVAYHYRGMKKPLEALIEHLEESPKQARQ